MKTRRHHNNKGTRQIKRGHTTTQAKRIARKLGVPFAVAVDCPVCDGDGKMWLATDDCDVCGGSGNIKELVDLPKSAAS